MDMLDFLSRLTARTLLGAALGTLIGLVLMMLEVIDNPFWLTASGIMAAALLTPLSGSRRQSAGARR